MTNLEYLEATCVGSPEMMKQILEMFLNSSPDSIGKMKQFIQESNWTDLKREAHKTKSSFLMMGAKQTGSKLQDVETLSGEGPDSAQLSGLVDQIEKESHLVYEEIKNAIMNL